MADHLNSQIPEARKAGSGSFFSRYAAGLLLALVGLMVSTVPGALREDHQRTEQRRVAALEAFPFRVVIPPEVPMDRITPWVDDIQAWFTGRDSPLGDPGGRVQVLTSTDLARLLPLQESWISEGLRDLPLTTVLPTVLEVRSPLALQDAWRAQDLTSRLRSLHPNALVAHEQLTLDATLAEHRAQRSREAVLQILTNTVTVVSLLVLTVLGWLPGGQRVGSSPVRQRRVVGFILLWVFATIGWSAGGWFLPVE